MPSFTEDIRYFCSNSNRAPFWKIIWTTYWAVGNYERIILSACFFFCWVCRFSFIFSLTYSEDQQEIQKWSWCNTKIRGVVHKSRNRNDGVNQNKMLKGWASSIHLSALTHWRPLSLLQFERPMQICASILRLLTSLFGLLSIWT